MFCLTKKTVCNLLYLLQSSYSKRTVGVSHGLCSLVFIFLACWERLAPNDSGLLVAEGSNLVPISPSSILPYIFITIKLKVEKLVNFR